MTGWLNYLVILLAKWRPIRRGESGGVAWGGPLWNPVWGTGMPAYLVLEFANIS